MSLFKPMLAKDCDLEKLRFPLLASAKLDGVRAIVQDGVVLSRSLKPLPNIFVQEKFAHLEHYDGELIFGPPTAKDCYRRTVSAVMGSSTDGADVNFWTFDHVEHPLRPYTDRIKLRKHAVSAFKLDQHVVTCMAALLALEEKMLDLGYEGLILRDPNAPYKYGRSTVNEGYLLKLKRFTDDEAEIIGFEERQHNGNEATTNELGRTKRSSHQAGKTGRGDLGALLCRTAEGVEFSIGTGFDDALRAEIWNNQDDYFGKLAKYKHFVVGSKDKPRFPVFLGFRADVDI